jgi:hypothetical protein
MPEAPWRLPDGTLMRVTKLYSTSSQKGELLHGDVAYAVSSKAGMGAGGINTIWLGRQFDVGIIPSDEYEIVDPDDDQVPDEVWAKLALYRLTGDVS